MFCLTQISPSQGYNFGFTWRAQMTSQSDGFVIFFHLVIVSNKQGLQRYNEKYT